MTDEGNIARIQLEAVCTIFDAELILRKPTPIMHDWSSPESLEYQLGFLRFGDRLAMIDNGLQPVLAKMLGGLGVNLHPAMFWPEWGARMWELLESEQWSEAQSEVNRLLFPFYEIYQEACRYHGGEGHVDKLALKMVGLPGGPAAHPFGLCQQPCQSGSEPFSLMPVCH